MTEKQTLADAVKTVAVAYVLLHMSIFFGINESRLDLLPNWLGYLLLLRALPRLGEVEPSALLLRPLGVLLAAYEGILWAMALFGISFESTLFTILATALALYFHFQLLTNLADIASQYGCPEQTRILRLRTVRTVLITLFALPLPWEQYAAVTIVILMTNFAVTIWICAVLFSLRGSLQEGHMDIIV